jgi:hypothetical protein
MLCAAVSLGQTQGCRTAVDVVQAAATHEGWPAKIPGWTDIMRKVLP